MNQKSTITVMTSAGLALNAAFTAGMLTSAPEKAESVKLPTATHSDVIQAKTNSFEASFLKVPHACKVDHASFEAVRVAIENIPAEVRRIHAEVENA